MHFEQNFSQARLTWLKNFILPDDQLSDELQAEIINASSVSDIWCLIFRRYLFALYADIIAADFYPTAKELEQPCGEGGSNAWFYLASSGVFVNKRDLNDHTAVFQTLLTIMVPSAAALSICDTNNNTNTWYWLSGRSTPHIDIFNTLLQKGVFPTAQALSRSTTDNDNSWYWLARNKTRIAVFETLVNHGILPSAEALNQYGAGQEVTAWHWLAGFGEKGRALFATLLSKDILPSTQALAAYDSDDNTNAWFWLAAGSQQSRALLARLISNNVLPTTQALALESLEQENSWYWLTRSESGRAILATLISKNILPTSQSLALCSNDHHTHGWFELAQSKQDALIFASLLAEGILPTAKALTKHCTANNTNAWFWLASYQTTLVWQTLFDNGIVPSTEELSYYHATEHRSAWFYLAGSDERIAVFQQLLSLGIFPSQAVLNTCDAVTHSNAWFWLTVSAKRLPAFLMLLQAGILPSNEALAAADIQTNHNVWYWLTSNQSPIHLAVVRELLKNNILPDAHDLDFTRVQAVDIKNRLTKRHNLAMSYNIDPQSAVALVLSHQTTNDSHGFLYLFYLATAKLTSSPKFPYELWFAIGRYLIPHLDLACIERLAHDENRLAFVKYHVMKTIDTHFTSKSFIASLFEQDHNPRAKSLHTAVKNSDNPTCLLRNQFFMSQRLKKTYVSEPVDEHQKPFVETIDDPTLAHLLEDSYVLTALQC